MSDARPAELPSVQELLLWNLAMTEAVLNRDLDAQLTLARAAEDEGRGRAIQYLVWGQANWFTLLAHERNEDPRVQVADFRQRTIDGTYNE